MKLVGSKKAVRTAEFHRRQERAKKVRLSIYSVLAILLIVSPFVILRSDKQFVTVIEVKGGTPYEEKIMSVVESQLEGYYLGFLPRKSIFIFPAEAIKEKILKDFPQFSTASVVAKEMNKLTVDVTTREPFALFCLERCYFLDAAGTVYDEAPDFTDGVFSIFGEEPARENVLGSSFLDKDKLAEADLFFKKVTEIALQPKILIKAGDEYKLQLDGGAYVLWKTSADMSKVFSNLSTVFNNKVLSRRDLPTLEYVDLRFGDKVYYKFRE